MGKYVVRASGPLNGSVRVSGATKNSGLKQMAAALLAPGTTVLRNMCPVADLQVMTEVMRAIGADVTVEGDAVTVDTSGPLTPEAPYHLVRQLRASINVLGPLLGFCGEARVALPGGDNIGNRPLDMHLRGFEAMGAEINVVHGFIEARAPHLTGARHVLEFPSVGATENLLTAAVLAKGTTVIENAAREPEITDLCAFLTRMGAQVIGGGTATIEIEGVDALTPVESVIGPDRIETATLLIACGIAGGEVTLEGANIDHLEMLALKLGDMGMRVSPTQGGIWAKADGRLRSADVVTLPHPGFATDIMPPMVALLSVANGTSIVTENIFDNRFGFTMELNRMGADIRTEGRHAVVRGVERLSSAPVNATDVRAGVCLMLAGLAADGETEVYGIEHVERGYCDLVGHLRALGADVERAA
jgi:UDP-N-acetylglucosamine 1-carboxyvinyltransferase